MKVEITRDGMLRIITENETEEYALERWRENALLWNDGEKRTYNPDCIEFKSNSD